MNMPRCQQILIVRLLIRGNGFHWVSVERGGGEVFKTTQLSDRRWPRYKEGISEQWSN